MKKKGFGVDWKVILMLFFLVTLSLSFYRNILRVRRINREMQESRVELAKIKKDGEELKLKLGEAKSEIYIEKQIRDKLGFAKEGETVLVLPPDEILRSLAMDYSEEEEILPEQNWQKWLKLFF